MSLTFSATTSSPGTSRETRSALTRGLLAQLSDPDCSRRAIEDEVIRINLVLALQEARRYEGRGIEIDDLRQVASLGLVKAVRAYDPAKATDFVSFAVPSIRGELRRWFRDRGWMVRPPRSIQELQAGITAANDALVQQLGRTARPSELAAHLAVDVEQVIEAVSASGFFRVDSLDAIVTEGGSPYDRLAHPEDGFVSAEARLVLGELVRALPARERRILELRFYQGASQAEIGAELGVTQAQVSRLLSKIFRRLRERLIAIPRDPSAAGRPDLTPAA